MSRAPYSSKKPKKPEYEEPPELSTHTPFPETPSQPTEDSEPTRIGVAREEKELPITHIGEEHDAVHRFANIYRESKPEPKTIYSRTFESPPSKPEKIETKPTKPQISDSKPAAVDRWRNVTLTTARDINVESREKSTRHKVVPVKEDGAHQET